VLGFLPPVFSSLPESAFFCVLSNCSLSPREACPLRAHYFGLRRRHRSFFFGFFGFLFYCLRRVFWAPSGFFGVLPVQERFGEFFLFYPAPSCSDLGRTLPLVVTDSTWMALSYMIGATLMAEILPLFLSLLWYPATDGLEALPRPMLQKDVSVCTFFFLSVYSLFSKPVFSWVLCHPPPLPLTFCLFLIDPSLVGSALPDQTLF